MQTCIHLRISVYIACPWCRPFYISTVCEWSIMFDVKSRLNKIWKTNLSSLYLCFEFSDTMAHPFVSGVHWCHFVSMRLLLRVGGLISSRRLWRLYHRSDPWLQHLEYHHRGLCDYWSNAAQYRCHSLLYICLVWNLTRYKTHWWLSFPSGTLNWVIFLIFHWIYKHCDLQCLN